MTMMQTVMEARPAIGITLRSVCKVWGESNAVDDVSLEIEAGKFTAILGPSGCGKSTTLRIIAGLDQATSGQVLMGGRDVSRAPPSQRDIAMVFQSYALFPHLTVAENIAFGMKVRGVGRAERMHKLERAADILALGPLLARKPSQLSGGQQQRVALARAIVSEKSVFLMDEPLSNLDAKLRHEMREEIRSLQRSLGVTMVYVTHDQIEAVTMADHVVLMNRGRIEQSDTPRRLYERPATLFAASFIGTPPMSVFDQIAVNADAVDAVELSARLQGTGVRLGVRPEALMIAPTGTIQAKVLHCEYLGSDTLVTCEAGGQRLSLRADGSKSFARGEALTLGFRAADLHVFDRATGSRRDDLAHCIRGGLSPA